MYYLVQTFVVELILYCFIIYTICLIFYIEYSVTKEETIPLMLLTILVHFLYNSYTLSPEENLLSAADRSILYSYYLIMARRFTITFAFFSVKFIF